LIDAAILFSRIDPAPVRAQMSISTAEKYASRARNSDSLETARIEAPLGERTYFLEPVRLRQRLPKRRWGGMVLSKVRFLSVVGAKLRTEVVAARRPPKFKITIAETERLVAEHAAVWAVDDEICCS
jgi:hypothetical protein